FRSRSTPWPNCCAPCSTTVRLPAGSDTMEVMPWRECDGTPMPARAPPACRTAPNALGSTAGNGRSTEVIVAGFIDTAEGHAALDAALREARLRAEELCVVVQAPRGAEQADLDRARTAATEAVQDSGVPHQVQTLERGADAPPAPLSHADQAAASLIIIGLRRRS